MKTIRSVLVVEPYGIGDLLFVTPVLRALRLIPTIERVDMILGSRTEAVVRHNPHVDEIFSIDKDLFHQRKSIENVKEIVCLTQVLKTKKYDLLLDYSQRQEYGFWGIVLGIPVRSGLSYKNRGIFLNRKVPIPNGFEKRHVVDFYAEVAEKAGVLVEDRFLEFYLSDQEKEFSAKLMEKHQLQEPFIAVAPGGGESWGKDAHFKQWPAREMAQFLETLSRERKINALVLMGGKGDAGLGEELVKHCSVPQKINLCGATSLAETGSLLARAQIFVGNDGGLLHLAKALQIPVIGFYGPADSEVYGPYPPSSDDIVIFKKDLACRPCYRKFRYQSDCAHRDCLQSLTAEEALSFLKTKIGSVEVG